jgi:transposase
VRSVRRIAREESVVQVDDAAARAASKVGRPSKVEGFRKLVTEIVGSEPDLLSVEILRRVRQAGYKGGKSALYPIIAACRPKKNKLVVRFEGLPGEFAQHDFGEVDVRYRDRARERVHFFASRLKYSRWIEVTLVPDQTAETLVRTLVDHFSAIGGVPLLAVFDRPKTVALKWNRAGEVTEWNPIFAYVALELGIGVEVCWPYSPQQKGSVENLVRWVKGSFFKQRTFADHDDLVAQLAEWRGEVNERRPSDAT